MNHLENKNFYCCTHVLRVYRASECVALYVQNHGKRLNLVISLMPRQLYPRKKAAAALWIGAWIGLITAGIRTRNCPDRSLFTMLSSYLGSRMLQWQVYRSKSECAAKNRRQPNSFTYWSRESYNPCHSYVRNICGLFRKLKSQPEDLLPIVRFFEFSFSSSRHILGYCLI